MTRGWKGLLTVILMACCWLVADADEATSPGAAATQPASPLKGEAWEWVGAMGAYRIVYVEPSRLNDPTFMATLITTLLDQWGRDRPLQIEFFDDRKLTPTRPPYPPESKAHRRAKFNFNPRNGMMRFVRLLPPADGSPTGKPREVEEKLPL